MSGPTAASTSPVSTAEPAVSANWRYWNAVSTAGMPAYASNLAATPGVLALASARWPIVRHRPSSAERPNAYPVCLTTQYLRYAAAELHLLRGPRLRVCARAALPAARALLAIAAADRIVQWNGWGFSTNPLPGNLIVHAADASAALAARFPDDAVLVRNLDDTSLPGSLAAFAAAGYLLIASRQVYHFDGRTADYLHRDTTRRDRKLLARADGYSVCEHEDFSASDMPRIAELYRMVYIERHSHLNVDYRERFFTQAWGERWLELVGLRNGDGRIDAVMGCLRNEDRVSTPFLGHDTSLPADLGLYRRLVAILLERTAERREQLNFSSGADEFKRRRGGCPTIEYNALHVAHLPRARRLAWAAMAAASARLAGPVLSRIGG